MTKLQLKVLQDLKSCPEHNGGEYWNEAHKHFLTNVGSLTISVIFRTVG